MRVIAGKYRGRTLRSLRGMDIRPTSDRLRETLFNVLTAGIPSAWRERYGWICSPEQARLELRPSAAAQSRPISWKLQPPQLS